MHPPEFKLYQRGESQPQQQQSQDLLSAKREPVSQNTDHANEEHPEMSQGEAISSQQPRRQRVNFSQATPAVGSEPEDGDSSPPHHLLHSQWPFQGESQQPQTSHRTQAVSMESSSSEESSSPSSQQQHPQSQSQFPMTQAFSDADDSPSQPSSNGESQSQEYTKVLLQEILQGDEGRSHEGQHSQVKMDDDASPVASGSRAEEKEISPSTGKGVVEGSVVIELAEDEDEDEPSFVPSTPRAQENNSGKLLTQGTLNTSKTMDFEIETHDHLPPPPPRNDHRFCFDFAILKLPKAT